MKNMKSLIASIAIVGVIGMAVGVVAQGATEASVTSTVTVQNISVTVANGTVAYGTLGVNTSKDTTLGGLNNTQVATNNGNVSETLNIKGQPSASWTLGAAAGSDVYVHQFCKTGTGSPDPCDANPVYTALTTSYQALATPVAAGGNQRFDLKITTPTVSTSFVEQSVNVTVQAVAI